MLPAQPVSDPHPCPLPRLPAYTVGIANFCGIVSGLLGSGVIQWSGMRTVGDDCDFEALPYLIVVFQMLVPMLIGIPAAFLIPVR